MSARLLAVLLALVVARPARADEVKTFNGDKTKVEVSFAPAAGRGEAIYKTYCHHCHGDKGDGTGHIGKGLQIKPVDLTAPDLAVRMTPDNIARIVREGSGKPGAAMIPWKTVLRDEQIRDVAEFTSRLAAEGRARRMAPTPAPAPGPTPTPAPTPEAPPKKP